MGTSSGTQTTQSNSQTQPWQPAIPALQNILGNVQGLQGQAGINPTENAAIQQLTANAGAIPNFGPTAANTAASYFGGDPSGILRQGYQNLQGSLGGLANPNNLNPLNTPGFASALDTLNQDITNQINGQFAAAGRSGSGLNTQTLARGLSQGEGQLLANQYNQNVQNLENAANAIYGGGIGTNQALGQNTAFGGQLAGSVPGLSTQGPSALLAAGQAPFNLQAANQAALSGIATPIASLGGQSSGTQTTNTTQSMSPVQMIGGLFGGQYSPVSGLSNAASGILGGLGQIFGPNLHWG